MQQSSTSEAAGASCCFTFWASGTDCTSSSSILTGLYFWHDLGRRFWLWELWAWFLSHAGNSELPRIILTNYLFFKLLFNYSCSHFPPYSPLTYAIPTSHIQPSPTPSWSLPMGPLYLFLDLTLPLLSLVNKLLFLLINKCQFLLLMTKNSDT